MSQDDARRRWARIDAVFEGVLRAPSEKRDAMMESLCRDDPDLREEVASLLKAHAAAGSFLETTADVVAASYLDDLGSVPDAPGLMVGRYRLVERIGRGGMGTVWLAERTDGGFRQRVAVKLVKRGMDTQEVFARFLRERRILGRLEHPHIARILDGGATDDGRPYFVMEHVDGLPITEHCEQRSLSLEDRLVLFETVCRAVQHAHKNLVVHRDIKPSNVLVTEGGEVKLLDFGISKVLEEEEEDASGPVTRVGVRPVTPDYASPEQVRGEPVTTQSDVYQLGLLLYELLAGRRAHRLTGKSPAEIERVVTSEEPRPPSSAHDGKRSFPPQRLHGDLDTITLTAVRKEPARRYASAEALAEDVRRHLAGLPVAARGDGAGYRAGKFLRRHRGPVAAAAVLAVVSSTVAILYTVRLQEERDRVRMEAEKATVSAELLEGFFVSWNPDAADRDQVTARDLLDVAAQRAAGGNTDSPEVRAATLSLLGSLYTEINAYAPAESLLRLAERAQRGAPPRDRAATAARLGHLLQARGDLEGAEARYREALALHRTLDGPAHPRTLAAQVDLARLLWSAELFSAAEAELRGLLRAGSVTGQRSVPLAEAETLLGTILFFQGKLPESEAVLRAALEQQARAFGPSDPLTLETALNLAGVLRDRGDLEESERIHRQTLAGLRSRYGDAHYRTLSARFLLGMVLERKEEYAEGEALARAVMAEDERRYGADHPASIPPRMLLASILMDRQAYEEAEARLDDIYVIFRSADPPSEEAGDWLNRLAYLRIRRGAPDARAIYEEALAFHHARPSEDPAFVTDGFHFLAWSMHRMGDLEGAEALYRQALGIYRPALPEGHPYMAASLTGLGEVLLDLARAEEAEPYLRQAMAAWAARGGETGPEIAATRAALDRARAALRGARPPAGKRS